MSPKTTLSGLAAIIVLVGAFYALNSYIYTEKQGETGFQKGYKDISYFIQDRDIQLVDGKSEIVIDPEFNSKITTTYFGNEAEGDLNGDGISDIAFILVQNGGGSGNFVYAVAALKTDTGYVGTNGVLLGDRIAPQSTEIRDGILIVNYADRKPDEPFATPPSVGVSLFLRVTGTHLAPDMGAYGYRCGDGTEFTMSPVSDMSAITLIPASNVERIPRVTLSKTESATGARYEGQGIVFHAHGEGVDLKTSTFETTCMPMQNPDEAPFNFGD